jgi:hypothetical protein
MDRGDYIANVIGMHGGTYIGIPRGVYIGSTKGMDSSSIGMHGGIYIGSNIGMPRGVYMDRDDYISNIIGVYIGSIMAWIEVST